MNGWVVVTAECGYYFDGGLRQVIGPFSTEDEAVRWGEQNVTPHGGWVALRIEPVEALTP